MTDDEAFRKMSSKARAYIRRAGFVRCRRTREPHLSFHHPDADHCDCIRAGLVPHDARPVSHGVLKAGNP